MCEEKNIFVCKQCNFFLNSCEYCILNSEYKDTEKEELKNVKDSRIYKI